MPQPFPETIFLREVYDNLVAVVHENLPAMHRYVELRKKLLGVDKLYMYDMYVPLIELPEHVRQLMKKGWISCGSALQPLGKEYLTKMNKGIEEGWIDVYENKGKTSGAYSFGCYDSYPYILLNYTDTLKDVFTIIHEMGHSMHFPLHERRTAVYLRKPLDIHGRSRIDGQRIAFDAASAPHRR